MRPPYPLWSAMHAETEPAASLALEAWLCWQRFELERSLLLADAAERAHVALVRSGEGGDVESARFTIDFYRQSTRQ